MRCLPLRLKRIFLAIVFCGVCSIVSAQNPQLFHLRNSRGLLEQTSAQKDTQYHLLRFQTDYTSSAWSEFGFVNSPFRLSTGNGFELYTNNSFRMTVDSTGRFRFVGLANDSLKTRIWVSDTLGYLYYRNLSSLAPSIGAVTSIGTYNSQTASANGLVISGNSLFAQSASATKPGMVDTTTQTFSGSKSFSNDILVHNATIGVGNGGTTFNVALGYQALAKNKTIYQVAVGDQALANVTSGQQNTAVGAQALYSDTSASYNTAVGAQALYSNTNATSNTAVGALSLQNNTTGTYNTAVGRGSLTANSTGSYNVAVGGFSLGALKSANYNVALGFSALQNDTSGNGNIGIGVNALNATKNGSGNVAIGTNNLASNTSGSNNIAINGGYGGSGIATLSSNTTGNDNIGLGEGALNNNTVGTNNIALGYQALFGDTSGLYNTAIGYKALNLNKSGNHNIGIGYSVFSNMASGSYNTVLGDNSAPAVSGSSSYNTIIGAQISGLSTTLNNTVVIADGQGNKRIYIDSTGNAGIGTTAPADKLSVTGNLNLTTAGNKIKIATGTNASAGSATLSSGTITINTTSVTASSLIFVVYDAPAGTLGSGLSAPSASIVAGTSFVINSLTTAGAVNTSDTSKVRWWLIN